MEASATTAKKPAWQMADKQILAIVILLVCVSMLAVFSASGTRAYKELDGDTAHFIVEHIFMLAAGLIAMAIAYLIPSSKIRLLSNAAIVVSCALLVYTFFFGLNINNAQRSIRLFGLTVQPSDIAKIAIVMFTASIMTKFKSRMHEWKVVWKMSAAVGVTIGLVFFSNLSTAFLMGMTYITLLIFGSVKFKHIAAVCAIGALVVSCLMGVGLLFHVEKLTRRVDTWENRFGKEKVEKTGDDTYGKDFQQRQAQLAVASGGITGKGLGHSTLRYSLPHPYSDFIYSIIVEESGLVGALIIISLYLWLFARVRHIVRLSDRIFSCYLVIGLTTNIIYQAFMHMAVALGVGPVTGQPLPMISMGGSAIMFTGCALGMILRVSRETETAYAASLAIAETASLPEQKDTSTQTDSYHEPDTV